MRTWQAFILALVAVTGGLVWASFYPNAPYTIFAPTILGLFTGYGTKRLLEKQEKFQNGQKE
jgi:hypothetical protein